MNNYRIFNKKEIFASIVFSVFLLLLPLAKASVVLNATDFISFNISSSEIARIVSGGLVVSAGWINSTNAAFNQICLSNVCKTSWPANLVGGSGTQNYLAKWTASDTLGNSIIYDTGTNVGIGTTSPVKKLDVVGDINATGAVYSVNGYYVGTNQIITSGRVLQNIASISQSLLPTSDNTYDFGSSSYRWRNAYFSGTIYGNIQGSITPTGNLNMNGYSIYNAYDVNATRFFQGGNRVIDTINAGNGLSGGGNGPSINLDVNVNTAKGLQIVSDALETKIGTGLAYDGGGNIYVVYGSSAGTAVQGNTQLTINTGTGLTGGTTITLGAGGTVNLGIDNSVVPFKGNNEQISGSWTFLNDLTVMKNLRVAGNITYVNVQTINVNGSLIPPLDNWFDIGNSSNRWRNANFAGSVNTNNLVVSGYVNSNLVPGTDNSYNLGSSSNRWANVYAVNVYASNINGGSPITGSGSTNYVAKFTGSNTLGNSIIYDTGTNVGIGTTLPVNKLNVIGDINATGTIFSFSDPSYAIVRLRTWGLSGAGTIYIEPAGGANLELTDSWSRTGNLNINFAQTNFQNASGTQAYITSNGNAYFAGNVGIGTTSPSYKLDVVGDIRAQNAWLRTTGNTGWYSDTYGGGWYMSDSTWIRTYNSKSVWTDTGLLGSNGGLTIGYGGASPPSGGAIIAGNVGIGTTSPTQKLEVVGNVNASVYYDRENSARYLDPSGTSYIGAMSMYGSLSMNNYDISGVNALSINDPGAGEGLVFSGTAAGWVIDVSPLDRSNNDGNLNLYGTANNIIVWRPTYVYTSVTPQLVINSTGTTAQFILQTSNTVRGNITADSSGNVYITPGNYLVVPSGNVGIGTTSPATTLDVNGNTLVRSTMTIGQSSLFSGNNARNLNVLGEIKSFGSGAGLRMEDRSYTTDSSKEWVIYPNGNYLRFWSGLRGDLVAINYDTGYVGIGTTSPSYKLDVSGDIRAQNAWLRTTGNTGWYSDTYGGGWYMSDTTWIRTYNSKSVWTDTGLLGSNGGLTIGYGGASPPSGGAIIAGNVGIGTTTPASPLHVKGTGHQLLTLERSVNTVGYGAGWHARLLDSASNVHDYAAMYGIIQANTDGAEKGALVFYTANPSLAEKMRITAEGNVGIGTTAPSAKLQVVGGAIMPEVGNSASAGIYFPPNPGGGGGDEAFIRYYVESGETTKLLIGINNDPDDRLSLYQYGAERLTIYNGNVGIGTTNPGEKLEVAGNVKITGSRIKNSAGYGIIQTDATDWLRINPDSNYPAIALYNPVAIGTGGLAIGEWSQQSSGVLKVTQSAYLATAGGNVGIGTTSPSSKLEVYGGNIEINDGSPTGTYKIVGKKNFYAGDETQVSSTSTTYELKKQFTSVFSSDYGIKPRYVNVIARIWNGAAGKTTYLNVTLEGCAGTILSATSTSATLVKGTISVDSCSDGLYPTKIYLSTTSGGTAYNDLIEFYYVE